MYSCDGAKFSAALTPVFSVTWSFRKKKKNNNSHYYNFYFLFCCIIHPINAALVSMRDFLKKTEKEKTSKIGIITNVWLDVYAFKTYSVSLLSRWSKNIDGNTNFCSIKFSLQLLPLTYKTDLQPANCGFSMCHRCIITLYFSSIDQLHIRGCNSFIHFKCPHCFGRQKCGVVLIGCDIN